MAKKRIRATYEEASAWGKAQCFKSQHDWFAKAKDPDFPKGTFPKAPDKSYPDFLERGGWTAFLGIGAVRGASKVELILKAGLNNVLDLDQSRTTRIDVAGPYRNHTRVDIADRHRRLIIEYDGSHWHKSTSALARDLNKDQRLRKSGWSVIRVREAPLPLLDPVWDVEVSAPKGVYGDLIRTVLTHLRSLVAKGLIADDGLASKIEVAMQTPIDERAFYTILTMGYRPIEETTAWAQQQGIRTSTQWNDRTKAPDFPPDIPKDPRRYPDFMARGGWGVLLGTGNLAPQVLKGKRWPYERASAWAQSNGILSQKHWDVRAKQANFPDGLPKVPNSHYPDFMERGGWGAFLGTGNISTHLCAFWSYEKASAWAQGLTGLAQKQDWMELTKRPDFPRGCVPKRPETIYPDFFERGGWRAFFGTTYWSYEEASACAKQHGVRSCGGFRAWLKDPTFPTRMPKSPHRYYPEFSQNGGWSGFFGTSNKFKGHCYDRRLKRLAYVIRLAKPGEAGIQRPSSNDPAFVMPWAA
ncbi:DUF559 domain-containing protein [Burkholderia vietnamiensis]|uniref:DUF559 domain-containing protein n=1 Tax=Burkholderia vietnamiensis TaxID=60552 RepID=UPI001CF18DCC|nr:DUF559 domain-containing protein [Burkholderia vietnamiensis]MCA8448919.1 DUF559 domain-containing protein [Burkholderia vietnamiensis]